MKVKSKERHSAPDPANTKSTVSRRVHGFGSQIKHTTPTSEKQQEKAYHRNERTDGNNTEHYNGKYTAAQSYDNKQDIETGARVYTRNEFEYTQTSRHIDQPTKIHMLYEHGIKLARKMIQVNRPAYGI